MRMLCLALALALLPLAARAESSPPACLGKDLIRELQRSDSKAYTRLVDTASAVANGEGLLWRIERAGHDPSHLFGTIHVTDDRLAELAPEVAQALDGSRVVALELAEIAGSAADQARMQQKLLARGVQRDGSGLDAVPPRDREMVLGAFRARGLPAASVGMMKPWMLLATMSVPGCELLRAHAGIESVDERIGARATKAGTMLVGLESVDEQIDALSSIDPATAAQLAVGMARLGPAFDDVFETLIGLYLRRQIGLFFGDLSLVGIPPEDVGAFTRFTEILVDRRNRIMADRAVRLIDKGGAFIGVGALHLVGEKGLVELLRARGYTVTKVW